MSPPPVAALLSTGRPERLYTGLSVLASSAADGRRVLGLASFAALDLLIAPDLEQRARRALGPAELGRAVPERLARSLVELRDALAALPTFELWACAASMQAMELDPDSLTAPWRGVRSTPVFLRLAPDASLLFI